MKTVAVDIDGILTKEIKGYGKEYLKRTPRLKNIRDTNKLYDKGYKIILYTARYEEDRKYTITWLKKNKVKYHLLVMNKLMYDYLVDDKAFPTFKQAGLV